MEIVEVISNIRTKSLMTDDCIEMQRYLDAVIHGLRIVRLQRDLLISNELRANYDEELKRVLMTHVPDAKDIP